MDIFLPASCRDHLAIPRLGLFGLDSENLSHLTVSTYLAGYRHLRVCIFDIVSNQRPFLLGWYLHYSRLLSFEVPQYV